MPNVRQGLYRHFKGGQYRVEGVAKHADTDEEYVIYRPIYGNRELFIRAKSVFLESVEVDGQTVPRFAYISEER